VEEDTLGHGNGRPRPADLVLIGHAGFAVDRTPGGTISYLGGSGVASAFAATALIDRAACLVTQVGGDFDMGGLRRLRLGLDGVAVVPGASARFVIDQLPDGSLRFSSDLGVAAEPRFDLFPAAYFDARFVHLGTAPPRQQLEWLDFLRHKGCHAEISVDMFEPFVEAEPEACRKMCDLADLVFLNEAEFRGIHAGRSEPRKPTILKHGPGGAEYLAWGMQYQVQAPAVAELDPIGAGEILAGSFLALRTRGMPVPRALTRAVAAAARSVTEFGVTGPAVTSELRRLRDELDGLRSQLQAGAGV
jgi:sugar/nucleoside kinase (ribokinase family)